MTTTVPDPQDEQEPEFPEAWRPSQGASLEGEIIGIEAIDPSGRGVYPVVTVRDAVGKEWAVHAFHNVLRRELARRRPQVGDRIGLQYLGKRDGGQNPDGYHNYRVKGGAVVAYDWSGDLSPEEREEDVVPIASAPVPSEAPQAAAPAPVPVDDSVPF